MSINDIEVGDKVRVRDWDDMVEEFGVDDDGDIPCRFFFTKEMESLCGIEFVVTDITESHSALRIEGLKSTSCCISCDMVRLVEDDIDESDGINSFLDEIKVL